MFYDQMTITVMWWLIFSGMIFWILILSVLIEEYKYELKEYWNILCSLLKLWKKRPEKIKSWRKRIE